MAHHASLLERFRKIGILSELDDAGLEAVADIARRVSFDTGETIMHEGENGETMYLFVEGEVDVTKNLTLKIGRKGFGQAEKSMNKLKAEHVSVFGEMAMFGAEPRSATITAASQCVLYEISREDFASLCAARPTLGVKVLRRIAAVLSSRVRKGNEDVLKLSTALSIALSK
ncbi:MAG: cyclic nucleotide-binding domain-containing protein [Spirochaetes bacterium]|nr:cyclic nucleotide-binding domain-containing protein [Spirochaetota bacterium]